MGHLYDARDQAKKHTVAKNQTLAGIAAQHKGADDAPDDLIWQELALYNWATQDPAEVTRALCERIGSANSAAVKDGAAPESLALDPDFGPSTPEPILIPKLWKKKGLELKKIHTIKVRKHTRASTIGIKKLDKWFIPETETCDVDYATAGDPAFADRVDFEVYASNYAGLSDWKNGLPAFTPLPDVPVYKDTRSVGVASITNWHGLSNCTQGALSPADHALNVAFSPYTVMMRYSKESGPDPTARIDLQPFWVLFTPSGKPVADSCKVTWSLKNGGRLKVGLLQISDKTGAIVFAKGLNTGDLAKGSFDWDGKDSKKADVTRDNMPYRVQIEAHTDIDEPQGLAIAAMHTEVRLYVHKDTHPLDMGDYKATTDQISLDLSMAPIYHKDAAPVRGDGSLWTKYQLALAGFYPGPVTDAANNTHFETALKEFQKSVPKAGGGPGTYTRLAIGADDDDTKDALAALDPARRRPWFGKPADPLAAIDFDWKPTDWPDPSAQDFLTVLRKPDKRMIVWVDDRNWYTNGIYWKFAYWDHRIVVTDHNLSAVHGDAADLGGDTAAGRGSYEHRDLRVGYDARDIARPWIPLQAGFRLLSKAQSLDDAVAEETTASKAEAIRKAIGPLRVDWTFDEIEKTAAVAGVTEGRAPVNTPLPVLDREIEETLRLLYHPPAVLGTYARPEGTRTRIALRWALDRLKAEHIRVDVNKTSKYYNSPEACGGIRPDDAAQYFRQPFGLAVDSLAPWTAAGSARQSVYCVVHDRVGQPDESVFNKRLGLAGVYFHPSRIAGDGYQVRAQVRFDEDAEYKFPNAAVLKKRYEKLPQAHTAEFRLWRKTSIRGYVKWGPWPTTTWTAGAALHRANLPYTGADQWRAYYTACHVHISNELNAANNALPQGIATFFPNVNDYRDLVLDALPPGDLRGQLANQGWIALSPTYCWPWAAHPFFGVPEPSQPNTNIWAGIGELSETCMNMHVFLAFRMSLAIVKGIEKLTGRMRGHILVEYQTSPDTYYHQYGCPVCNNEYTYIQNASGTPMLGRPCPTPGCAGSGGALADTGDEELYVSRSGGKPVHGINSPSCGFPVGVFWNFLEDSDLWAHELGHNRHYEHAGDAMQNPARYAATTEHDFSDNLVATFDPNEKAENKRWDRACLMTYVTDAETTPGRVNTYDDDRDMPCFCYKCVLKNRGWRLNAGGKAVPLPAGDMQDP